MTGTLADFIARPPTRQCARRHDTRGGRTASRAGRTRSPQMAVLPPSTLSPLWQHLAGVVADTNRRLNMNRPSARGPSRRSRIKR
jgi:hypothetical protein